jgi:hypothetical protein
MPASTASLILIVSSGREETALRLVAYIVYTSRIASPPAVNLKKLTPPWKGSWTAQGQF